MLRTATRASRLTARFARALSLAALATGLSACSSTPDEPLVSAGLDGFTGGEPTEDDADSPPLVRVFADNAAAIERFATDEGETAVSDGPVGAGATLAANPAASGGRLEVPLPQGDAVPALLSPPAVGAYPVQGPPADASTLVNSDASASLAQAAVDQLLRQAARRLVDSPEAAPDPLAQVVQLALLDALWPGITAGAPDPALALTPEERAAVDAWRASLVSVGEALRSQQLDAPTLIEAGAALGQAVRKLDQLRIETAALARRVEGFGRYSPLPTPLLAGRPHPVGLYVEVSGFARTPAAGPEGEVGYVVELGEEVSLYHEPDGLLAWRRPEQIVRDFSRRPRRDFFLVDRLDLPSTLTVGSYRLKVRVTDKATAASAEAIIPFEVVADRSLAGTKR